MDRAGHGVVLDLRSAAQVRQHVGDAPLGGTTLRLQLHLGQVRDERRQAVVVGAQLGDGQVHEFAHTWRNRTVARLCSRRRRKVQRAAATKALNRAWSRPISGCHCTPTQNRSPGTSIASTVSSGAHAVATKPGCVRTDWWWWQCAPSV